MQPMKSVLDVIEACEKSPGKTADFRLLLNYGLFSRKTLTFNSSGNPRWYLYNHIDDTEQEFETDEELLSRTHIGLGIERSAFILEE